MYESFCHFVMRVCHVSHEFVGIALYVRVCTQYSTYIKTHISFHSKTISAAGNNWMVDSGYNIVAES